MSAWYVMSALGFYPFDPCGGDYVIGAPQVPGATLRLPGGVRLNGKPHRGCVLRHADVMAGGTLEFEMAE